MADFKIFFMNKKETALVAAVAVILLLVSGGAWWYQRWVSVKMSKMMLGLSEPIFPFHDRTEAELAKLYPQVKYADVPTRTTPEETYAQFRLGLKENNLEMVLAQLDKESGRYNENVTAVRKAYEEGKFAEIYKFYPSEITKTLLTESIAQYEYVIKRNNKDFVQGIDFAKDKDGDWKMKSL